MANRLKGEACFDHEGETLTVLLTASAWLEIEDATGIGILNIESGLSKLRFVATILQKGLLHGSGQDMSVADAVDMMAASPVAAAAVMLAVQRSFPETSGDAEESADANPPVAARKKRGAGKPS